MWGAVRHNILPTKKILSPTFSSSFTSQQPRRQLALTSIVALADIDNSLP